MNKYLKRALIGAGTLFVFKKGFDTGRDATIDFFSKAAYLHKYGQLEETKKTCENIQNQLIERGTALWLRDTHKR